MRKINWECGCHFMVDCCVNVSESDMLGPIEFLSDIKNLVPLERAMFEDYSFKYKMKIFRSFMSISPLWKVCLKHHEQCTCQI